MEPQQPPSSLSSSRPKVEFYSRFSKRTMATPLNGTVVITGASGSLGSKIALKIARRHPLCHLLLTARDVWSKKVEVLSEEIRSLGPRSFEIAKLDLASFRSVRKFTKSTVDRVRTGDIPSIQLLINCAAIASFKADAFTEDGFDLVYQTNCLAPFLLTIDLLEAFRLSDGGNGTRVINIGCSLMSHGKLDHFDNYTSKKIDSPLGVDEGLVRFGSSKLLLNALMYALRRSLAMTSKIDLTIFTLDPTRTSYSSRHATKTPAKPRMGSGLLLAIPYMTQMFLKNMINSNSRSAEAVVKVAFDPLKHDRIGEEKYFVLEDEYYVRDMVKLTNDHEFMEMILRQSLMDVGVADEEIVSPV